MLFKRKSCSMNKTYMRLICGLLCALLTISSLMIPESANAASEGVTNAKVVLRKEANTESKALQTLYAGEDIEILSTSGDWYKVRYGKYTGYVMKKYVKTSSSSSSSSSKSSSSSSSVSSKIKALGSAPGIMRVGDENSDVKKLQQALEILGYYNGKIDGIYGNGTTAAVKAYQKAKGLSADGYAGERTVKSIFGSCNSKSLTTQAAPGSSKSSSSSGNTSSTTAKSKYPTVNSIAEIGSAPATSRKGDSGTKVVKLQQALECLGYYDGAIDGDYGNGTYNAVKKFQQKRGMKADGVAGTSTIRVLFGEDAANTSSSSSSSSSSTTYKTEVLDWYADNVSKVIPKGARFTVKDIGTGKTFEMRPLETIIGTNVIKGADLPTYAETAALIDKLEYERTHRGSLLFARSGDIAFTSSQTRGWGLAKLFDGVRDNCSYTLVKAEEQFFQLDLSKIGPTFTKVGLYGDKVHSAVLKVKQGDQFITPEVVDVQTEEFAKVMTLKEPVTADCLRMEFDGQEAVELYEMELH